MSDTNLLWRYSIDLPCLGDAQPDESHMIVRMTLAMLLRSLADAVERGNEMKDLTPTELRVHWEHQDKHTRFAAGLIRIDEETQSGEH